MLIANWRIFNSDFTFRYFTSWIFKNYNALSKYACNAAGNAMPNECSKNCSVKPGRVFVTSTKYYLIQTNSSTNWQWKYTENDNVYFIWVNVITGNQDVSSYVIFIS